MTRIPYCPPGALTALIKLNNSGEPPGHLSPMWHTLKARGWMSADGKITSRGRDYVNLRLSKL